MKILKKISAIASILLVGILSSCSDKGYWEEAPLVQGYSFEVDQYVGELTRGVNQISLTVARTIPTGSQTLNVTFTPGDDTPTDITVPATLTFADGSYTADLVINIADAQYLTTYSGTIKISGDPSYAGTTEIALNCPVGFVWNKIGTGTFYDEVIMTLMFDLEGINPYPVEILKADGFNRYRVLNPYVAFYQTYGDELDWYGNDSPEYIEFWENEDGTLSFNEWYTGLNYDANKNYTILAMPWDSDAFMPGEYEGNLDIWYDDGFAVLSPIYEIDNYGAFGQMQYAVQIKLPETAEE